MDYEKIYDEIIARRRRVGCSGLAEKHHVLPKSVYPERKDDPCNIVALPLREHFVCHKLLVRIYELKYGRDSVQYKKMLVAFAAMTNYGRYRKYASARDYEKARTEFHDAQSDLLKLAWRNYPAEKMEELRKKRRANSGGENNPMYGKDWRDGKTEEELRRHGLNTSRGLARRTEAEKAGAIRKALETKSKYTDERRSQIRKKRANSIRRFNAEHPGFRRAVAMKSAAKTAGNRLMVNPNVPGQEKRVLAPDIDGYLKAGWRLKSDMKDTANAAYGRRWMYDPATLEQAYPKKEDVQAYLDRGYVFGNLKNYKRKSVSGW